MTGSSFDILGVAKESNLPALSSPAIRRPRSVPCFVDTTTSSPAEIRPWLMTSRHTSRWETPAPRDGGRKTPLAATSTVSTAVHVPRRTASFAVDGIPCGRNVCRVRETSISNCVKPENGYITAVNSGGLLTLRSTLYSTLSSTLCSTLYSTLHSTLRSKYVAAMYQTIFFNSSSRMRQMTALPNDDDTNDVLLWSIRKPVIAIV